MHQLVEIVGSDTAEGATFNVPKLSSWMHQETSMGSNMQSRTLTWLKCAIWESRNKKPAT